MLRLLALGKASSRGVVASSQLLSTSRVAALHPRRALSESPVVHQEAQPAEIVGNESEEPIGSLKPILRNLFAPKSAEEVKPVKWTPNSKRTGVVAVKQGMMHVWDDHGVMRPCTVLRVQECQVIYTKPELDKQGRVGLQLGAKSMKWKNVKKMQLGHFHAHGVTPKRKIAEFRVSPDAVLPSGYTMRATHFVPGQYVDCTGISKGKGFQGGMKRWNFGGLPASHGVSLTHRSIGSTGQRQQPGKVFKGKKMPGQMGNGQVTMQNLQVFRIDTKRDLLYVLGAVPGNTDSFIVVRDAHKRPFDAANPPPYPTYIPEAETPLPDLIQMPADEVDPFAYGLLAGETGKGGGAKTASTIKKK